MIMMTSAVRVRKCERGGRGRSSPWCGFPTQAAMQLQRGYTSLTTGFIMEGGGCQCAQWAGWIYTLCLSLCLPFRREAAGGAAARAFRADVRPSSCATFLCAPFRRGRRGTELIPPCCRARTHAAPARTWMVGGWDVKESMWMNKWCRPAAKKRKEPETGRGSLFKNASLQAPLSYLRAC